MILSNQEIVMHVGHVTQASDVLLHHRYLYLAFSNFSQHGTTQKHQTNTISL